MPNSPEPLRLPPADGGWTENLWIMLGALLFGAMLVAAGIWTAPALVSDWRIRDAARPLTNAEIRKGKCTSRLIFHVCDATLAVRTANGLVVRDVNYVFTGVEFGDRTATVMADPNRLEHATTDMALDRLWNRTLTLLIVAAVLLAFTILPLVALVRRWRTDADVVAR